MLQSIERTHTTRLQQRRFAPAAQGCRRTLIPREAIEQAVVQVFGVGHDDLHRMSRGRARIALARQVAMYLAHVACGLSLTDTGRLFGRDRTTVAHACGVIEDRRDDPLFDRALDLLEWAVPSLATRPSCGRLLSL
jgi:chromosomal replication initiation ATPase DnaA